MRECGPWRVSGTVWFLLAEPSLGAASRWRRSRDTSPQAAHHFTQADQVNQLVWANESDPDLGFMARLMALCSLPRTNPR